MKDAAPQNIRTIAIVGHQGSGKTSLVESMLFLSGAVKKLGSVDGKSTATDFEPEEQDRGGSLSVSIASCEHGSTRFHLLDTPGDGSFHHEARSALQAADGIILVVSAVDGVEVETERIWEEASALGLPCVVFVNKMDRERADAKKVLGEIRSTLGGNAVSIELPIGAEDSFKGTVDLLRKEARLFGSDTSGKTTKGEIPDDMNADVEAGSEALIEAAAEGADDLIEKYLEAGELTSEETFRGMELGICTGKIVPVLYGTATGNKGVGRLMEVATVLPSPLDAIPRKDQNGDEVASDPDGPFAALVVKTLIDPYAGTISVLRVVRGSVGPEVELSNTTKESSERITGLYWLVGKELSNAKSATVGDLIIATKLKKTSTGDTLCDPGAPVQLAYQAFPPPMARLLVKPATKADEDKVRTSLQRIVEEDPGLILGSDSLTSDICLSGAGQAHIEMAARKMKRKYGVDVTLEVPPVPYRETIRGSGEVEGKHKKQSGGRGQFGVAWLRFEPLPRDGGFEFVNAVVGGVIPRQFIPAVEKGVVEAMVKGVLAGYPVTDLRITVYDGKHHPVDSSEAAFKIAGSKGFKQGFLQCQPILLEPIVQMEITIPEENVGDVMGDVSGRRGRVQSTDYLGKKAVVKARVPMAEILTYAPDLRSMTQGKGVFTQEDCGYEEVPANLQDKIVASASRLTDDEGE